MKLPLNCEAEYHSGFLTRKAASRIYRQITEEYKIGSLKTRLSVDPPAYSDHGKLMFIDRDLYEEGKFPEQAWGKTAIWPETLHQLRKRLEAFTGKIFQVCVCIYYPDGNSGVDYHSDYIAFGDTTVIPSISLGEERIFHLREKRTQQVTEILLEAGSLLIMGAHCQERYEHSLPIRPEYRNGRINLTFRQYGFSDEDE